MYSGVDGGPLLTLEGRLYSEPSFRPSTLTVPIEHCHHHVAIYHSMLIRLALRSSVQQPKSCILKWTIVNYFASTGQSIRHCSECCFLSPLLTKASQLLPTRLNIHVPLLIMGILYSHFLQDL